MYTTNVQISNKSKKYVTQHRTPQTLYTDIILVECLYGMYNLDVLCFMLHLVCINLVGLCFHEYADKMERYNRFIYRKQVPS